MNCKNSIGILSVIIILLCGCQPDKKTTFIAASYNLRNANSADSLQGDGWGNRCPIIADLVQFHEFDIFGTQEGLRHQLDSLKASLPKYNYIGVGRNDGKKEGEHAAIFYRIDKFELLEHGDFWLSETPEKPSVGWDAVLPRICTWGHFKYKETGFEFLFFNLHMDHIGVEARREGAKLIVQKVREMCGGEPVIITGDFNVDQNNEIYQTFVTSGLLKDSYVAAEKRFARNGTFNSFKPDLHTESRIDHIFVSPAFAVRNYAVLTDGYWTPREDAAAQKGEAAPQEISLRSYERRCPSDHYPVAARIEAVKRR